MRQSLILIRRIHKPCFYHDDNYNTLLKKLKKNNHICLLAITVLTFCIGLVYKPMQNALSESQ